MRIADIPQDMRYALEIVEAFHSAVAKAGVHNEQVLKLARDHLDSERIRLTDQCDRNISAAMVRFLDKKIEEVAEGK